MNPDELLDSYDYLLPPEAIAQCPATPRDHSRLLVIHSPQEHCHQRFFDLPQWLRPGDLLVVNDTKVIPARLLGETAQGQPAESLLLQELSPRRWLALVKPGKRFRPGAELFFPSPTNPRLAPLKAIVVDRDDATGGRILEFALPPEQSLGEILDDYGQIPFPPYVSESAAQPEQYQTVYSQTPGAVAAPTAGLHFTPELLAALARKGIQKTAVTLHVGVGTFRPVETAQITDHVMHQEWVEIPPAAVAAIQETRARGGRIIAVGTTVVRSLEGVLTQLDQESLTPFRGEVNLFIYPGYRWRLVDGLITNFHLPKSSLLMLVSALIGRPRLLALYQEAIDQKYRFYSFGDAMLILPEARYNWSP
ncbi:MAG: tRNA preQ1(34) S-adenosylmethionine ribosyltransferase-isomerase QueA [Cyanobacteria bacterium RI_101]|nr:tRNA preQ1(34) S-adenosylmethionine ribosyltransferase-isomerase QueA [Cyanobacteria bacterium RI_101]